MRRGRRRRGSLYASGSGVYGDLGELEADEDHGPLVPGLDLRREQARRRGADLRLRATCSASRAARSGSATSSARARRTASASTSCAGCSTTRPGCAILGDGTQSKSYVHVDDVRRAPCCSRATQARSRSRVFNVATGDYITVTRDRRAGASRCVGLDPATVRRSSTPAATAAGRATCRSCGSPRDRIRALGLGAERAARARRCARRCGACSATCGRALRGVSRAPPSSSTATACSTSRSSRDGRPYPPATPRRAASCCPGVGDGVRGARARPGCVLIVVTNQPDIARGTQRRGRASTRSTRACAALLPLDEVVVCPHDDADGCDCRKPRPGMIARRGAAAGTSTCAAASRSATAGATSRPGAPPGRVPSSSTGTTTSRPPTART